MKTKRALAFALLLSFATTAFGFVDDTPEGDEAAPAMPGAKAVIPLDVEDPTYNLWKKRREDLSEGR